MVLNKTIYTPTKHFPFFSNLFWVKFYCYCKEKLLFDHPWGWKGRLHWLAVFIKSTWITIMNNDNAFCLAVFILFKKQLFFFYYRKVWNAKFRKRISNPCIASFLSIVSNFSFVSNDGVRERCFSSCHRRGTRKEILSTYDESNPRSSDSLLQCPITEPQRFYGERGHYEVHVWFLMGTQNIFFVLCSFQKSYLCLFLVCFIFLINNICFLLLHL